MTINPFLRAKDFLNANDDHQQKEFFERILQLGIDFKASLKVRSSPFEGTVATVSFDKMPREPMTMEKLMFEWRQIASKSANWAAPTFLGFPDAGNAMPALGAAVLIPFLNQNLANQEICAPMGTFIEMEVVHWLREQLGFSVAEQYTSSIEIGGILTLGGCLSNTIGIMAAREHLFPGSGKTGLPIPASRIRIIIPQVIEHYSIRSAMAWLSMGEDNVVRAPIDEALRYVPEELEKTIQELKASNYHVLACIAYAGDTRGMCIDRLDVIADILQRHNIWFHVDACHGSQLAFSRKHRDKLVGIDRADSVTIDPHKVLCIPYNCSFVLFKDPKAHARILVNSELILQTQWSLGMLTPCIGSKAFDSLKLWSLIKYFGSDGLERIVDARLDLTASIQELIRSSDDLLLLNETDINSCMFIYLPVDMRHILQDQSAALDEEQMNRSNRINAAVKQSIMHTGLSYLHGFHLKMLQHPSLPKSTQIYVLRIVTGNPLTTIDHVSTVLKQVLTFGQQHEAEI